MLTKTLFKFSTLALALSCASVGVANEYNPDISLVLDGRYTSNNAALGAPEKGLGLGHTELTIEAPVDDKFFGRLTGVLESHGNHTELMLEEAFFETTQLDYGLKVKAGRFLANVGYLNSRHTHEDDFTTRPAAYRAMLGSHYFDDGLQISALMPTDFYWSLSAEAFNGKQLAGSSHDKSIGVSTLATKLGGDIDASNSWQLGAAYLHNRLTELSAEGDDHNHGNDEHGHDHSDHDHSGHSHSAAYTGKHLYIADAVWKWAPNGNSKNEQLTLSAEYLLADELNQHADDDIQQGWYVASAYKFDPSWKIAARIGQVDLAEAHGDHFHYQKMDEADLALTWSTSHFSQLRVMYSHQESEDFDGADNAITFQFLMILGAHGAHAF